MNNIFNNDLPFPRLRQDLNCQIVEEDGMKIVVLIDPKKYAEYPAAFPLDVLPVFNLIDGEKNISEVIKDIRAEINDQEIDVSPILNMFAKLDKLGYLESPNFFQMKSDIDEYIKSPVRMPVCAGSSYPIDKEELKAELDTIFKISNFSKEVTANSIIVPHIDFRIGLAARTAYAAGYESIKHSDADLYVIFGTAHYLSTADFMFTEKDFLTPLGKSTTDIELIDALKSKLNTKLVIDELAHRMEHSIELHVVLLQYLFNNPEIRILPILTGSLHNYIRNDTKLSSVANYIEFINTLNNEIKNLGRRPIFIASADLAHIGRKFDDDFDAESQLKASRIEDEKLIEKLKNCDADGFFDIIAKCGDKRNICGIAPIYALLQTVKPQKCESLTYYQWNEIETRSSVSFASLAYY